MIITEEQHASFADAAVPLIKWLNENCHPHMLVCVEQDGAWLMEGVTHIVNTAYIKD